MKKSILLLFLPFTILTSQTSFSQVAEWIRTEEAGLGSSHCVDQFNNVFTIGQYVGTVQIGANSFTSAGVQDVAVTKMDPNGTIQWAISIGGTSGDFARDIVYDGVGGIWICGQFQGTLNAGALSITSNGGSDGFLIKINASNGQVVYAQNIGSGSNDDAVALQSDQAGSIFLAGTFQGGVSLGGVPINGLGSYDAYLYKLDFNGNVSWGTGIVGSGVETMWSFTIDDDGNSYVAGHHSSATTMFGSSAQTIPNPSKFIAKFDPFGSFIWVATGIYNGEIEGICVDASQNVYYTGNYDTQAQIGSTLLTGNGLDEILIGKISSDGSHEWAVSYGGAGNDAGKDIACNSTGDVFVLSNVAATFNYGAFPINAGAFTKIAVAKLNTAGTIQWVLQSQGAASHISSRISYTSADEVYVSGVGSGTFSIGGQSTALLGPFLIKFYDNANNIEGLVFNDQNADGIVDAGDNGIPNVIVELNNQFYVAPSNAAGIYNLYSGPGAQIVSVPNPPMYYTFSTPATQNVNFVGMGNTSSDNNFGLVATPNMNDLKVDIVGISNPKKGYVLSYLITYKNQGTTSQNATLNLNFPGIIDFLMSAPNYDGFTGNTLEWNLGVLAPQELGTITVHFYIPTSLNVGDLISSSVSITPDMNDQTPSDNSMNITQAIVGPYDPNYKTVNIDTLYDVTASGWLDYTIHFQNVGTDTAHNVIVIDTLSAFLKPGFLEIISKSHPNLSLQIREGNVVEFRFDQIMLPDSSTNQIASQGFVKFRIQYIDALPLFETIENFVDIYFDYEASVRTDTARTYHTTTSLSVAGINLNEELLIFPNPAGEKVFIRLPESINGDEVIRVYALDGKLQQLYHTDKMTDPSTPFEMEISRLRSGVYILELTNGEQRFRTKFVKR